MAIARKHGTAYKLADFRTWITDTDPNSRYFQLSELAEVLTAGKNSFLINGSSELLTGSEILMELIAADGTSLFMEAVKNFTIGLARAVSIWVYQDTARGAATLTILGRLSQDANGNPVPPEWQNSYNIKWQTRLQVAPDRGNTSPVRLHQTPTASVTEILNPFRAAALPTIELTGSVNLWLTGSVNATPILAGNDGARPYIVVASTASFKSAMKDGVFTAVLDGLPFTSSVSKVVNNRMLQLSPPYLVSGAFAPFVTNAFRILHTSDPIFETTESTRSFADLTITRLSTFSGDIYRVKVFVSSVDSPGHSEQITDVRLEAPELMQTSSYETGQQKLRTGLFVDQSTPDNYWVIGLMTSGALYNPS